MSETYEYVHVPWGKDDDEPEHPELESGDGEVIDPNDARLTQEIIEVNPKADAYGTTLRVRMNLGGLPESVAETPYS